MSYYLRSSTSATWSDLERFVERDKRYVGRLHKYFQENPFTLDSFEILKENGLAIEFRDMEDCKGELNIRHNRGFHISLKRNLEPYQRDVTLFHELMHGWYHPLLDDSESVKNEQRRFSNASRTEWLARKARAQPELLRTVILGLHLTPKIYDRASYLAFEHRLRRRTPGKYKYSLMD